jgi:hypothetical protein
MSAPKLKAAEPRARSEARERLADQIEKRAAHEHAIETLRKIDRWPFIEAALNAVEAARAEIETARAADFEAQKLALAEGEPLPAATSESAARKVLAEAEQALSSERKARADHEARLEEFAKRAPFIFIDDRIDGVFAEETGAIVVEFRARFDRACAEALDMYDALHAIGGLKALETRRDGMSVLPMLSWRAQKYITAPSATGEAFREVRKRLAEDADTQFPEI